MSEQVGVDVPHSLGTAEAKRRIEANLEKLRARLPAGAVVRPHWDENRLGLDLVVLAQQVTATLDVQDTFVRITVTLPPALAFFGRGLTKTLRETGSLMLKDETKA